MALAFEMQKGHIVIPTSGKAERIRSNYGAIHVKLTPAELAAIETVDRGERVVAPSWGPAWD